jgi:hypothetical protein
MHKCKGRFQKQSLVYFAVHGIILKILMEDFNLFLPAGHVYNFKLLKPFLSSYNFKLLKPSLSSYNFKLLKPFLSGYNLSHFTKLWPAFVKKKQFLKADMKKIVVEGGVGVFLKTPPDFSAMLFSRDF